MLHPRLLLRRHYQNLPYLSNRSYATAQVSSTINQITPSFVTNTPVTQYGDVGTLALKRYKPRTPGVRHLVRPINDHLWKGRAHLPLTFPRKGHHIGGRNNSGRIMVRHRGGGHKRRIRIVDFSRSKNGRQTVERIEYDPGRSAHIALVTHEQSGAKSYILASEGMRAGDVVESFREGLPQELIDSVGGVLDAGMIAAKTAWRGNCLPLHMIPVGTMIYNVGLRSGSRGQMCRSAGTYATIVSKNDENPRSARHIDVRLQSGEIRKVVRDACATIGTASNPLHNRAQLGKAGRSRWLGIRPTVRGLAMNACDHPHGGGRGKSKGNVHPISIWGRTLAKGGFKTRKKSNVNRAVVVPRPRQQGRKDKLKQKAS